MPEGRTRAWLGCFESVWETKCERSSGTGLCLFGYSLVASTNSAASIHLPVPVITDPQHAQGLTRIFGPDSSAVARRCAWRKEIHDGPDFPAASVVRIMVRIAEGASHCGRRPSNSPVHFAGDSIANRYDPWEISAAKNARKRKRRRVVHIRTRPVAVVICRSRTTQSARCRDFSYCIRRG
jgi:hypothetical protein